MPRESTRAIYASIGADLAIAATKFAAAALSGSAAMASEGVHSVADSANGLLLLLGRRRSRRPPDENHPFGHGKELYFWSLIVAILFFALGGGVSLLQGVQHIRSPAPLGPTRWAYIVLAANAVFTLASFSVAIRQFRRRKGNRSYWQAIRQSKDPTLFTLVLSDVADLVGIALAFLGVLLSHLFHAPYLDGVASLAVGALMAVIALILIVESKGLLIGEGANQPLLADVRRIAEHDPSIVAVRRPATMHFGPRSVLVGMGIEFRPDLSSAQVAEAIDRIERDIRQAHPEVRFLYVEAESVTKRDLAPAETAADRAHVRSPATVDHPVPPGSSAPRAERRA